MPYTGNPATSATDRVHFLVGDTNAEREVLSDGEIEYLLQQSGGVAPAAALQACYACIARLGDLIDQTVGGVSMAYSQLRTSFEATLGRLKTQSALGGGYSVYAGGVSLADKAARARNPDRPARDFQRDPRTAAPWQRNWIGGSEWQNRW